MTKLGNAPFQFYIICEDAASRGHQSTLPQIQKKCFCCTYSMQCQNAVSKGGKNRWAGLCTLSAKVRWDLASCSWSPCCPFLVSFSWVYPLHFLPPHLHHQEVVQFLAPSIIQNKPIGYGIKLRNSLSQIRTIYTIKCVF